MPSFDSTNLSSLRVTYDAIAGDNLYSYSSLSLQADVQDAAQLSVEWVCPSVTRQSDSAILIPEVDLDGLTSQQIFQLDGSQYTVNATADTVLLDPADVSGSTVTIGSETYIRPTFAVSASNPLRIDRDTDINSTLITYQPGSRLSHVTLNASNDQMVNALQEFVVDLNALAAVAGTVDLSTSSIGDLANVTLSAVTENEILIADATGQFVNETFVEADIASLSALTALTGRVTTAETDIDALETRMTATEGATSTNAADISTNTAAISTNAGNISTNAADILTNAGNISTNAGNISTNAGNITGLDTRLTTAEGTLATALQPTDSINDLSDVSTASPSTGDLLEWTGSQWEAVAPATPYVVQKWLGDLSTNNTTGNRQFLDQGDWNANVTAFESVSGIAADITDTDNTTPWTFPADWPAGVYEFQASCSQIGTSDAGKATLTLDIDGTTSDVVYQSQTFNTNSGEQLLQGSWLFTVVPGTTTIRAVVSATTGTININAASYVLRQIG